MTHLVQTRDQHLAADGRPKRILALDGGGLRGILTLGILSRIEAALAKRHGAGDGFRLAHYFDLIAGTSTGAIIAAALAKGMSVAEVLREYETLGHKVFEKSFFRQGVLRAKYDDARLRQELQRVYGPQTMLGSPELQTGLLVVTKRLDTGSPWPLVNNPRGRYFAGNDSGRIGNGDYPLWQVVRASTAAPSYFDPETITIVEQPGKRPVTGQFVDGGVSPYNNPALQAVMAATLDGYRIGWPMGAQRLMLVSVGTGSPDPAVTAKSVAAAHAIAALTSLMEDVAMQQQLLLQWLSASPRAREIDRVVGDLRHDVLGGTPLLTYLRYDTSLAPAAVQALLPDVPTDAALTLSEMDAPENMALLHRVGCQVGDRDVVAGDFPTVFDLPPA